MSRSNAVLFQDAEAWGLASSSPHCLVAQAALKFAGVSYSTSTASDSFASSTERPVLVIGDTVLTGAGQILDHLKSKCGLDSRLDSKQVARSYAFQCMIEDRLHKAWQYNMFVDNDNFVSTTRPVITQGAPFGSAFYISHQIRNSVRKSLDGITDACLRSVPQSYAALSALLGDSPYFCGDRPGSLDAVAFGHLALQLHATTPNQPFAAAMRPYPNLKSVCSCASYLCDVPVQPLTQPLLLDLSLKMLMNFTLLKAKLLKLTPLSGRWAAASNLS
jgi:metaxin